MFFHYYQNNPGGTTFKNSSVCSLVVIEAKNYQKANEKAQSIDIYFDGVRNGHDCQCCGNRWTPHYENAKGRHTLEIDGQPIDAGYTTEKNDSHPAVMVYFKNGSKQDYYKEE